MRESVRATMRAHVRMCTLRVRTALLHAADAQASAPSPIAQVQTNACVRPRRWLASQVYADTKEEGEALRYNPDKRSRLTASWRWASLT